MNAKREPRENWRQRLRGGWRRFTRFYNEMFFAPYRAAIGRERRDAEDLFLLLAFSDMLGIPNPVSYYTLELLPYMYERFHQWHVRQGLDRSPLEGFT